MSEQPKQARRQLLTAAAGGFGAFLLTAIGRAAPVRAEGETVVVGGEFNTATSVTKITSSSAITVAEFRNSASGASGVGLKVHSINGTAFLASSSNLTPAPLADTTIYGFHNGSQLGHSPVVARFEATEQSSSFATAIALQVVGKTQFSKSGVATVPTGQSQVVVPVTQITSKSFAIATLQSARPGVYVAAVTRQVSGSTITIILNQAIVNNPAKVGWIVMESPD